VGLDDSKVVVIDSLTAQKRLVEAGFGLALVPESSVREELGLQTLRALDVPALRASIDVTLIHRKGAFISQATQHLRDVLVQPPEQPRAGRPTSRRRR
jgi:DNA-binding transcriptional LysR family regulator